MNAQKFPPAPLQRCRFPLGVKVACLVTGLVVVLMGGFGAIAARRAAALLEEEIDARGSQLARVLAEGLPRATHTEFGRTWSVVFEDPPVEDTTGEWQFRRQQERKAWLGTFEQLCRDDLLNIVVLEGGSPTLSAHPPNRFSFEAGEGRAGTCRLGDEQIPALLFRERVPGPEGKTFGEVKVYMSLGTVQRARGKMVSSILLVGAGAALVGLAFSLLMGGMVSRPVRALTRDMAVVQTGNFDHRTAVSTADEIGLLAAAFNEMTLGLHQSERMRNDLRLARDIQARLLPKRLPSIPGFELAARYLPATEVSGDYYDALVLTDSRFGIAVGDVSGKGVSAGLIMTMTRALVRLGAQAGLSPKDLLERINAVLHQDLKRGAFVTLMYALVDSKEGRVTVASAGHNPLYLWTREGDGCTEIAPPGIALGVVAPMLFGDRTQERSFVLSHGDRAVIYTDGVTEAMSAGMEPFGENRLRRTLEEYPEATCEEVLENLVLRLEEHRRDTQPWDDITVVALRRLAPKPAAAQASAKAAGRDGPQRDPFVRTSRGIPGSAV